MSRSHSPRIVTNGMVLCLDAANVKSYPGSGTTWTDLSGNGKNGTVTNATFNSGNGGYFTFDRTGDYVTVPNFTINAFTICGFVKLNGIGKLQGIFGQASTIWAQLSMVLRISADNKLNLGLSATGTSTNPYSEITSTMTFTSGTWYHIAASFSKPNRKLYVNGSEVASTVTYGLTDFNYDLFASSSNIIIGGYAFGSGLSYLLDGNISSIQLYNRVLTEEEIKQNFNATRGRFGV